MARRRRLVACISRSIPFDAAPAPGSVPCLGRRIYKMAASPFASLRDLVPDLTPPRPDELARSVAIRTLKEGDSDIGLRVHQDRACRAVLQAKAALFIHHAGVGKTLAMIACVEQYRESIGVKGVCIIAKKMIQGFIDDDLKRYHDREMGMAKTGLKHQDRLAFYKFYTYHDFAVEMADLDSDAIRAKLGGMIIVIDELHTIISYVKRLNRPQLAPARSLYETLVIIRNVIPDMLIIGLSATPMLNSPIEIEFAAHVLLTQDQLDAAAPRAFPNHYHMALAADLAKSLPESIRALEPEMADGGLALDEQYLDKTLALDEQYARALVELIPVMYAVAPAAARQKRFGTQFRLHDLQNPAWLAAPPRDGGQHTDEIPGTYVRLVLPMGSSQRDKYINGFSKFPFFRGAREMSLCDSEGLAAFLNTVQPGERLNPVWIRPYSSIFAYWLGIEQAALSHGHWGLSAWYFDELVGSGGEEMSARLFQKVLLAAGWRAWTPELADAADTRPTVLFLSSKETLSKIMREQLRSRANLTGGLIRTIIYTKAVRDGVSFPVVFRGGSVLGWSEAGQLQADARRLRMDSFDMIRPLLRDPDFLSINSMYVGGTAAEPEINPHTYDVLSVPGGDIVRGQNADLDSLAPHYSIDAHMIGIRARKGSQIGRIFDTLVKGSVDFRAANGQEPAEIRNYMTHHAMADIRSSLAHLKPASEPCCLTSIIPACVPIDVARRAAAHAFYSVGDGILEGPAGGTDDCLWGLGSMGLGPAPISVAATAAVEVIDPEAMNVLPMLRPGDQDMLKALVDILCSALDKLAAFLLEAMASPRLAVEAETIDYAAVAEALGSGPTVLLAMYARFWCAGTTANTLLFGEKFPKQRDETALSENTRLCTWTTGVSTTEYSRRFKPRPVSVAWRPPLNYSSHTSPWAPDPHSLRYWVQTWSSFGTDDAHDTQYGIITHFLSVKVVEFKAKEPPVWMIPSGVETPGPAPKPGSKQPAGSKSGSKKGAATGEVLQGDSTVIALKYDELHPEKTKKGLAPIHSLPYDFFDKGRVFRYVLIPCVNGEREKVTQLDIPSAGRVPIGIPGTRGRPAQYVPWALEIIKQRLLWPWQLLNPPI
jgi:hypothetical protein